MFFIAIKSYKNFMHRQILRFAVYLLGLIILALGITLNVKTGLGVSPIISVAHVFGVLLSMPIGDAAFGLYSVFVIAEILIHLSFFRKDRAYHIRSTLLKDVLQLPLSLLFTRVMNIFEALIPQLDALPEGVFFSSFTGRFAVLIAAIACTGIGAAASLDMRIVPNPGDDIVQALADLSGKETGLVKNIFDGCNVALSLMLGFALSGGVIGIGIGTIIAFLGVGRFVALFNRFCFPPLQGLLHELSKS